MSRRTGRANQSTTSTTSMPTRDNPSNVIPRNTATSKLMTTWLHNPPAKDADANTSVMPQMIRIVTENAARSSVTSQPYTYKAPRG